MSLSKRVLRQRDVFLSLNLSANDANEQNLGGFVSSLPSIGGKPFSPWEGKKKLLVDRGSWSVGRPGRLGR
jgi:hypothetical protein